jgi:hypothetical protein
LACLEIFRWGLANIPISVFQYARELELDMEDIGFLTALNSIFECSHASGQHGVSVGQLLKLCPFYSSARVAKRISRLQNLGLLMAIEGKPKHLANKILTLDPLWERLTALIKRDHGDLFAQQPEISAPPLLAAASEEKPRTEGLPSELPVAPEPEPRKAEEDGTPFSQLANFIAGKTGTPLSSAMSNELTKWLEEYQIKREFLYCLLDLCFERGINHPQELTRIVREIARYQVNTLAGLKEYFSNFIDQRTASGSWTYDVELIELSKYLNIDMQAEARRNIYLKWREDWEFSQEMILKAGELMCSRTTKGGLEYMDSILSNWRTQNIRDTAAVEAEITRYRNDKQKQQKKLNPPRAADPEYELYIP